jgi:hypothetical protein
LVAQDDQEPQQAAGAALRAVQRRELVGAGRGAQPGEPRAELGVGGRDDGGLQFGSSPVLARGDGCADRRRHETAPGVDRDRPVTDATGLAAVCIGHNLAKEDPGHTVTVTHDGLSGPGDGHPHTIAWTTPTGHTHTGLAPPILGWGTQTSTHPGDVPSEHAPSPLEARLTALLAA